MRTKLEAAQRAARSGTHTIIASGYEKKPILRIAAGEHLGTRLLADTPPITARKQWIANQTRSRGTLWLDDGAVSAIRSLGKSLLSVGVRKVEGEFSRGDTVTCVDAKGEKIARGLVNYNVDETRKISGKPSESIEALLGYVDESALIHRDNLISL
jgi:glutamate 5-kinase